MAMAIRVGEVVEGRTAALEAGGWMALLIPKIFQGNQKERKGTPGWLTQLSV